MCVDDTSRSIRSCGAANKSGCWVKVLPFWGRSYSQTCWPFSRNQKWASRLINGWTQLSHLRKYFVPYLNGLLVPTHLNRNQLMHRLRDAFLRPVPYSANQLGWFIRFHISLSLSPRYEMPVTRQALSLRELTSILDSTDQSLTPTTT